MKIENIYGFDEEDLNEIETAKGIIENTRRHSGTYRSELQVAAEAEIKVLITKLRSKTYSIPEVSDLEKVYFISESRLLDSISHAQEVITWVPETVYRYLSSLPDSEIKPKTLQECMLNEYYYAGISFIDKQSYCKFFGSTIDTAKLSYEDEKKKYIELVEATNLDADFNSTPDLEKPLFVSQMAWKLAEESKRREDLANKRALEAEKRVKQLEMERSNNWRDKENKRIEMKDAEERHKKDPDYIKKKLRQEKKRQKKNK